MKFKTFTMILLLVSLTGCGALTQTPAPLPTVVLDGSGAGPDAAGAPGTAFSGAGVTASGVVAPAQETHMVFAVGEKVDAVNVAEGDLVEAGQELVLLQGRENLEAAVSAAQFDLEQAQQALDDLQVEAETARIQAMQDIITYEQAVKDAQYALDNFTVPSNQANLEAVEALTQMKTRLDEARDAFEPVRNRSSSDPIREDRKETLDEAQADYNAAVRRLRYEYDVQVAEARLARAQEDYTVLSAGPDPDKVRLAEANRARAEAQLAAAQAALKNLTLSAPFSGVISQLNIHSGEWAVPGQPVLVLADLSRLRVETTDLSERDVSQVEVGQPVTVRIEALGQEVTGKVSAISPLADTLGGDVVYKTTIELEAPPEDLRAGMSVEVHFGTGP